MNLVIRKLGRCPPFSHMGDLLNTCMLWIGLFECHILLENPVEFRYEPEFWLSFRFRSTESGIFKNTTPVPAQPEPDFQYIRYPAGYSGSVSGLVLINLDCCCIYLEWSGFIAFGIELVQHISSWGKSVCSWYCGIITLSSNTSLWIFGHQNQKL